MNDPVKPGDTVSHYRVVERLGGGGMGVVYRAEDTRLGRQVALKFLTPEIVRDENARDRFVREAQAASALDHPNVCTIYGIDETPAGDAFLVMALYHGETLKSRLANGPLGADAAVDVAVQIAAGLGAAHAHGIVHRDIKPANVMLTPDGLAKILDFGLATVTDSTRLTMPGHTWGTLAYMAPEQLRGDTVDHRTDLWALGVVLYEMLAGRLPFTTASAEATFYAILYAAPQPLDRTDRSIPAALTRAVTRALMKSSADRYHTAEEMIEALRTRAALPFSELRPTFAPRDRLPSIAVLPFADMSPLRDQAYFCEGIAEELINGLGSLSGLAVASRSSAFQFQGKNLDIGEIGVRLNVDVILDGSVRKADSRLRVTVQLVKVSDGYQLWSERFDRELTDVFAIQDEIARAVVGKLKVDLLHEDAQPLVRAHTADMEAYNLYLLGRYFWSRRNAGFLPRALECLERAIARDESYALAHTGAADAYSVLGIYGVMPPREAFAKAKASAERAIGLDDKLAEAHQAMAFVTWYFEWDWQRAEREYRLALALNPNAGLAHAQFGVFLACQGRFQEASKEAAHGVALDPVSALVGFYAAAVDLNARDYLRTLDQCRRVLELEPHFALSLWVEALALSQLGHYGEAIDAAERALNASQRQTFFLGALGTVLALSGHQERAARVLDELADRAQQTYVMPLHFADTFAALGNRDSAFEWLQRAAEERNGFIVYLATLPTYDSLRADPEYFELLARLGLTAEGTPSFMRSSPTPSSTEQGS